MSLKRKVQYVYIISGFIIAVALAVSVLLSIKGMIVLTDTLDDNDKALELYKAINQEKKLFRSYFEDEQSLTAEQLENACKNTDIILAQLPADYSKMDENKYIILKSIHNTYNSYNNMYQQIMRMEQDDEQYKILLDNCYKAQEYLENYAKNYESVTVSYGNEYYNSQKKLFIVIPAICVIIAVVVLILFIWTKFFISRKIVSPVLKLSEEARRISMNDFTGEDIEPLNDDEISILIKEFVKMKHSTKNYINMIEDKYKIEQQLEQVRFEMLKNQINPHFLFNTLNLIAGTAEIEDAATTEKMINTLSRLFRYNLKTQTSIMPLEQEIKVINDYMYLQQMRFGQRIKYKCDIDDACMDSLVPTFVLQPLVENAIIHGLSHSSKGGMIYVRCFSKDNDIWLSVADTGLGIEQDRLDNIREYVQDIFDKNERHSEEKLYNDKIQRKTVGVGIGNIAYRVAGMYNNSGMKIYSTSNHGTVVQVFIPCDEMLKC